MMKKQKYYLYLTEAETSIMVRSLVALKHYCPKKNTQPPEPVP